MEFRERLQDCMWIPGKPLYVRSIVLSLWNHWLPYLFIVVSLDFLGSGTWRVAQSGSSIPSPLGPPGGGTYKAGRRAPGNELGVSRPYKEGPAASTNQALFMVLWVSVDWSSFSESTWGASPSARPCSLQDSFRDCMHIFLLPELILQQGFWKLQTIAMTVIKQSPSLSGLGGRDVKIASAGRLLENSTKCHRGHRSAP